MESPFKKFMRTFGLFLLLITVAFIGFRYNKLKKDGSLDDIWNMSKTKQDVTYVEGELADPYRVSNSDDSSNVSSSSDSNIFTEKQNYDDYYNKFNFDNFILMYEGEQIAQDVIVLMNRLIQDADDPLYSKPMIEFVNFNGLATTSIGPADLEEYKLVLNQAKADVKGSKCNIEFGYTKLNSIVNRITITKK
ncbi:MAG: hypothetical protein IKJ36_02290 [Clostridia bacterium]|nr:hypothetical protein [Clostridia bacterium]